MQDGVEKQRVKRKNMEGEGQKRRMEDRRPERKGKEGEMNNEIKDEGKDETKGTRLDTKTEDGRHNIRAKRKDVHGKR